LPDLVIDQVEVDRSPGFDDQGRGQMRATSERDELTIQGWVIGKRSVPTGITLRDQGGRKIAEVAIDQPRADIGEAFPHVPGASTSGFRVTLSPDGSGGSRVHVRVTFDDGSMSEMADLSCEVHGDTIDPHGPSWSVVAADREGEKVMSGQEGWLYLRRDTNDILGQHTGKVRLKASQQVEWRQVLERRIRESERLGAIWSCVVAPDKESVYPEFLPDTIVPVEHRPIHEFLDVAADVGAPVTYALDSLLAVKGRYEVYPKVDTHWNCRGAYIGYRTFCDDLLKQGLDLEIVGEGDLEWIDRATEGDLGSKVSPNPIVGTTIAPALKEHRGRLISDNEVLNHGRVAVFEQPGAGLRCVLFGESFTPFMFPFLKETFQRLVFVHTSMFVTKILEQERPDVILSLPTERFLIRVPNDSNALAELRATALRKGGELPWPALT
jgi:alginate O-acetyltransferase complex protein AlgJ